MRRTISSIVLALGLVFAAVPAFAGSNDPNYVPPVPTCGGGNDPASVSAPCWPPECDQYARPWYDQAQGERTAFVRSDAVVAAQRATIAKQHQRIRHLRAELRRLRARR